MSTLRARCPGCRTLTAVAIGSEYQCHSCGREFGAGLVRVPHAWGVGGEVMAEAAAMSVPWPEAATIDAPAATVAVNDLEDRGLVVRETDPTNRRCKVVSLTDAGRDMRHARADGEELCRNRNPDLAGGAVAGDDRPGHG